MIIDNDEVPPIDSWTNDIDVIGTNMKIHIFTSIIQYRKVYYTLKIENNS